VLRAVASLSDRPSSRIALDVFSRRK